jgi:hypothetical protein
LDRVREQEDRFDVHRHESIEFSLLHLQHRPPHVAHSGIVDEDVDSPERIDGRLYGCVHVGALRHVAAQRDRLVADRGGGLARGLLVDVDDGHARALARERLGDAVAKARCGAGNQRNLVVETHACLPS